MYIKAEKNRCTFVIVILKRGVKSRERAMHFAVNNVSVPGLGSAHLTLGQKVKF